MRRPSLLLVVMLAWGLLACALPCVAAPRQLVFWTMQLAPFHSAYVQDMLKRFEAEHPGVSVKWVDVPWSEMERKVLASMAAGSAPDVVNLNPQFSSRLAEYGVLADPRQHLSAAQINAYLPAAWAGNQLAGVPFAVPWYLSTTVTLYNRSVLKAAGVAVPQTFAQLRSAAQRIHEKTGGYAWFPAMDGAAPLESMVAMTGALLTPDGCAPAFAGEPGRAVFDFYRELYQNKWVPPTVLTEGHRSAVTQFLAGQVAIVSTGMQFIGALKKNNPSLYAQVGVAPQINGGLSGAQGDAVSRPNIAAMNLAVPSTSREPALAFALAVFVTNNQNQLELARRVPLLPSTKASYSDALFTAPSGDALLDEARALSVQQVMGGMVQVPPLRHYHKLRTSFVRQLHASMLGRVSAQQAVDEVTRTWKPLLACTTP